MLGCYVAIKNENLKYIDMNTLKIGYVEAYQEAVFSEMHIKVHVD